MLVRHSATYLVGRVIPGAVSLVSVAFYTRLLTADQYGRYALVIAASGIINAIVFRWLALSLGRFLAENRGEQEALLSTALNSYLVLVVATGVVGAVATLVWPNRNMTWPILLSIGVTWAQAWFELNLTIASARLAPGRFGVVSSIRAVLGLAFGAALIVLGLGYIGCVLGYLLALAMSPFVIRQHWSGTSRGQYQSGLLRDLVAYGAPLTITFTMAMVLDMSDRFLIGAMMTTGDVGAYSAAYDLAQQSLGGLLSVVHLAAFPLAVRAFAQSGPNGIQQQMQKSLLVLAVVGLPATVGLVVLANNIAFTFMGSSVRGEAEKIIPIVALAAFVWGLKAFYVDYSFQLMNRITLQLWPVALAAVVNVLLNVFLIPRMGLIGAALATLVAVTVGAVLSLYLGARIFLFPPLHNDVYRILIAALGMGLCLYLVGERRGSLALASQMTIGLVTYGGMLIGLNTGRARIKLRDVVLHFKGGAR